MSRTLEGKGTFFIDKGPFQSRAPVVALAAPTATLKSDSMSGGARTLRVQVASPRHAENVIVLNE